MAQQMNVAQQQQMNQAQQQQPRSNPEAPPVGAAPGAAAAAAAAREQHQRQEDRYVTKVRELVAGPLKAKWQETLKEAGNKIYLNGLLDTATGTPNPVEGTAFESSLEDFFATCDQIEANLKTAIEVHNISSASHRYMTIQPVPSKLDLNATPAGNPVNANPDFLSYPQYIQTAKHQVQFANDMKQQLNQAANEVVNQHRQQLPK